MNFVGNVIRFSVVKGWLTFDNVAAKTKVALFYGSWCRSVPLTCTGVSSLPLS